MRKHHWLMAGAAVGLLLLWLLSRWLLAPAGVGSNAGRSFDSQDLPAPAASMSPAAPAPAATPAPPVIAKAAKTAIGPGVAPAPVAPTPPSPQTEVEKVERMVTDYHTLMGENPVGTNAEIMKEIMGANPHHATLGPPDGQKLNDKGELIDQWGTPFFFHQMSRDVMEIHSAGPDKIMGTADDVVTR